MRGPGFIKAYFLYVLSMVVIVAVRLSTSGASYPWDYALLAALVFLTFLMNAQTTHYISTVKLLLLHVSVSIVSGVASWSYAFGETEMAYSRLSYLVFSLPNSIGIEFATRAPAWTPEGVTLFNLRIQQVLVQVLASTLLLGAFHYAAMLTRRGFSNAA